MKFAQKLAVSMLLLLAAAFSIGGYFIVRQSFSESLAESCAQNEAMHTLEGYALQGDILKAVSNGEAVTDALLNTSFAAMPQNAQRGTSTLFDENGAVATTAQQAPARIESEQSYVIAAADGGYTMTLLTQLASPTRPLWLQSSYDITPLFTMRTHQMQRWQNYMNQP